MQQTDNGEHYWVIPVTLNDRPNGGVAVSCEQLPGLILAGEDRQSIVAALPNALRMLLEYMGYDPLLVVHEEPPTAALNERTLPFDVNMKVHTFVAVWRRAA